MQKRIARMLHNRGCLESYIEDLTQEAIIRILQKDDKNGEEIHWNNQGLYWLAIDVLREHGHITRKHIRAQVEPTKHGDMDFEQQYGNNTGIFDKTKGLRRVLVWDNSTPEAILMAHESYVELTSVLEGSGAIQEPVPYVHGSAGASSHRSCEILRDTGKVSSLATFFARWG